MPYIHGGIAVADEVETLMALSSVNVIRSLVLMPCGFI